jgi:hypothetical protein
MDEVMGYSCMAACCAGLEAVIVGIDGNRKGRENKDAGTGYGEKSLRATWLIGHGR